MIGALQVVFPETFPVEHFGLELFLRAMALVDAAGAVVRVYGSERATVAHPMFDPLVCEMYEDDGSDDEKEEEEEEEEEDEEEDEGDSDDDKVDIDAAEKTEGKTPKDSGADDSLGGDIGASLEDRSTQATDNTTLSDTTVQPDEPLARTIALLLFPVEGDSDVSVECLCRFSDDAEDE